MLSKLGIAPPLDNSAADILADYFETEEIGLAKDQDKGISYNEQYMKDICQAVNDFFPSVDYEILDPDDLNSRLTN